MQFNYIYVDVFCDLQYVCIFENEIEAKLDKIRGCLYNGT